MIQRVVHMRLTPPPAPVDGVLSSACGLMERILRDFATRDEFTSQDLTAVSGAVRALLAVQQARVAAAEKLDLQQLSDDEIRKLLAEAKVAE